MAPGWIGTGAALKLYAIEKVIGSITLIESPRAKYGSCCEK